MTMQITKSDYAQYDLHLEIVDAFREDDDEIIDGFAIRSEDRETFMFDLRQLVKRYGGMYET